MTQNFVGELLGEVFQSDTSMFKILSVKIVGELAGYPDTEIRVTGNFADLKEGTSYRFTGQLVRHPKFGLQFKANSYQTVLPKEASSVKAFLAGKSFPGIGAKAADKIVGELGPDALSILKNKPNKIATLSLSRRQKDSLLNGLTKMDSYSDFVLSLAKFGVGKRAANALYHEYREQASEKIKNNPYEPLGKVSGYGFKTADRIAASLAIKPDDRRRLAGALQAVLLHSLSEDGNTYLTQEQLLAGAQQLLQTQDAALLKQCLQALVKRGVLVLTTDRVFLQQNYQDEADIAASLKRLEQAAAKNTFADADLQKAIAHAETSLQISYDDTQKQAIKNALTHRISLLTGGPGTGKTTIINGLLLCLRELADIPAAALDAEQSPFLLAAPTGRAAKKMGEVTGLPAKTIHRLLGIGIDQESLDDLNELNGQILIVDEMSMVDMFLFKKLIGAVNETKHLVFVGDKDQLPSVGAGNVFADLIKSGAFATTKLEHIHRQVSSSTIIDLAHAVNTGRDEQRLFQKTANYSFIPAQPGQVTEAVVKISRLAARKFDRDDIQVLAAMYQGPGGINELNAALQDVLNDRETAKKLTAHDEVFKIGDRILQLQNNPEKNIYNGEIGKVIALEPDQSRNCLVAEFDDRSVYFDKKDLLDLTHAYAITIHKAQGSEFPLVILVLSKHNYLMLRRNLLYTAITRAAKNLVLVGQPEAFALALHTPGNDRQTGLVSQLRQLLKPAAQTENYILTASKVQAGQIDPMIGMGDLRPVHLQ